MAWLYLIAAGLFEMGWPLGLKLSQSSPHKLVWLAVSAISMAISGYLLWLAQRDIPIGTAYAVWTGIGAIGTFTIGVLFFNDPATVFRLVSVALIGLGIVGLKVA